MKLQQLIYAVKVAECGNITEASRRLFVSQPSITASIRELEAEMGVTIFERSNQGVVVTEEGETFLGYARQVLEQVDLLEERYRVAVAEPAAKIRLQTPPMRREIGSDHTPVVGELAGKPLDFPSEAPCARTTASP